MELESIIIAILTLTSGIGVFLVACQMMSDHLESAGSRRLKQMFAKTGNSKWMGVGIGLASTAIIQSSSAVTVMVVGFVNVGVMNLAQAATIIYGSNIGTTVTAQLVALGMSGNSSISTTLLFMALAGIGAFVSLFSKTEKGKQIGGILTGFGILFVGLDMMSAAMKGFATQPEVRTVIATFQNPLLLVAIGAILTAIIQSSSVMTSIAITMLVTGLINLEQGIYLTMGSNIGSCVSAILAGMASGTNAKRAALLHLLFNVMGVSVFLVLALLLHLFSGGSASFGTLLGRLFPSAPQLQLAMFHSFFNVSTTLIALPLTNFLVNTVKRIIPEQVVVAPRPRLKYLDPTMLSTPAVAIRQLKAETENMAEMAMDNFHRAIHIITTFDYSEIEKFRKIENNLRAFDQRYLSSVIRTTSDLERVGDYAENIVEYADSLKEQESAFSKEAVEEVLKMEQLVDLLYHEVRDAYHKMDKEALKRAEDIEEKIDRFTEQMEQSHIRRLTEGTCSPAVGAEYLSLAQNSERVADHLINVAHTIQQLPINSERK